MKKSNCCGDDMSCDLPIELPDHYIDDLYRMYLNDCANAKKEPLSKEQWILSISA